ncbi:hypothetical protein GCM10022259_01510 [Aquimarina mytili]
MGSSQVLKNIDEIAPFHEELAAVRQGTQWGFIDKKGALVIAYRDDLVLSKTDKNTTAYPYFEDGRCRIQQKANGISQFGYIDKKGNTVIKPEFLNATNFENGHAIVLKIAKEELGRNDLLDKKVVSYSYDEIVIDTTGKSKTFLNGPIHLVYKKDRLRKPPVIHSHFLSSDLIAVKNKNNLWNLYAIETSF